MKDWIKLLALGVLEFGCAYIVSPMTTPLFIINGVPITFTIVFGLVSVCAFILAFVDFTYDIYVGV